MDCAVYTGPEEIAISYITNFECSCYAQDMHCGTISDIILQCNDEDSTDDCDGPQITDFKAQRETV